MSDIEIESDRPGMSVWKGIALYFGAIVILSETIQFTIRFGPIPRATVFIVYLMLGILLNRIVLRRLIEWHPVYNTLGNVASAKFWMVLLWPVKYLTLFFSLLVDKYL